MKVVRKKKGNQVEYHYNADEYAKMYTYAMRIYRDAEEIGPTFDAGLILQLLTGKSIEEITK